MRRPLQFISYQLLVISYLLLVAVSTLPQSARALTATELLNNIGAYILNPIIYVLFVSAFIVFLWGIVQFIAHLDDEEARQTGGKHMLWGIIGMAIMAAVRGIVQIILNTITSIGSWFYLFFLYNVTMVNAFIIPRELLHKGELVIVPRADYEQALEFNKRFLWEEKDTDEAIRVFEKECSSGKLKSTPSFSAILAKTRPKIKRQ